METIDLAFAADDRYFPGLLVAATSLARHASRDVALRFTVLDGGIAADRLDLLRARLAAEHPHAELRAVPVDDSIFAAYPEWGKNNRMTYARLLLPNLLGDRDFAIYCDVDYLWLDDVAELWRERSDDFILAACPEGVLTTYRLEADWFAARNLAFDPSRYFCAGMLLMNLRRFRAEDVSRKIFDFLAAHGDVLCVDQSATNAVVSEVLLLPRRWGRVGRTIAAREWSTVAAAHLSGTVPWRGDVWWTRALAAADARWYRFYAEQAGVGYWIAVRRFLPLRQYFKRRLAWWFTSSQVSRAIFFAVLRLSGRSGYIQDFVWPQN